MTLRTSKFLMANLGAEVERILLWKEKNDQQMIESARDRAQKILDQIMGSPDMSARAKEIKMLNEAINDIAGKTPKYNIVPAHLRGYFTPFTKSIL